MLEDTHTDFYYFLPYKGLLEVFPFFLFGSSLGYKLTHAYSRDASHCRPWSMVNIVFKVLTAGQHICGTSNTRVKLNHVCATSHYPQDVAM